MIRLKREFENVIARFDYAFTPKLCPRFARAMLEFLESDLRFDQMMSRYEILSENDMRNTIFEVMQEIALAGLYRGGFFDKAAFYGGTCLRTFHSMPRFSEGLDFSLIAHDDTFNLESYFPAIIEEFFCY